MEDGKRIRRILLICQKCGENNSDNFRYCGMCGTLLEARRPVGNPLSNAPLATSPKITNAREPLQPLVVENAGRAGGRPVPPISGPSMLGLNQADANWSSPNQSSASRPSPNLTTQNQGIPNQGIPNQGIPNQGIPNQSSQNQSSQNQPSLDVLRDTAFSGLDSFFEPEQPKASGRRMLLMVVLLAALGGASWWTYTNYIGPVESRKPAAQGAVSTTDGGPSQATAPSVSPPASVPEGPSENATPAGDTSRKTANEEPKVAAEEKVPTPEPATRPATPAATPEKIAPHAPTQKIAARVTAPKVVKVPAPASDDKGDADFRKGEAYLYGRGMPENCDEAVKNLKAASAKQNAKARSAFGTMYATGPLRAARSADVLFVVCAGTPSGSEQSDSGKRFERGVEPDDATRTADGDKNEAVGVGLRAWSSGDRSEGSATFAATDARSPYSPAGTRFNAFFTRAAFGHDLVLQQRDRVDQLLRTRRTSGNVDIDRDDLVHALHERVVVEDAARRCARAHRDDPLRLRHLLPELANHRRHFVGDAAGNNHQVGLPRRWPEYFGAEARNIETRRAHRHHLDRAAGQAKRHRPDGILAHPVDGRVERGHDDVVRGRRLRRPVP